MNYELAKQLREAGFPNSKDWDIGGFDENGLPEMIDGVLPTLSELIEACGDNIYSIYRHKKDEWQAHSNSDQWDTEITHGKTPEEAVARLWLEINKK